LHDGVQIEEQLEQSGRSGAGGAGTGGCCPVEEWSSTTHTATTMAPLRAAPQLEAMLPVAIPIPSYQ